MQDRSRTNGDLCVVVVSVLLTNRRKERERREKQKRGEEEEKKEKEKKEERSDLEFSCRKEKINRYFQKLNIHFRFIYLK